MLRVIAGKYRTRHLEQPALSVTRPTMDRVKEAIFSMIQFDLENSIVLDLFSGSGALSIEAISRGAMKAIAVEKSSEAVRVINKNIESLKINNMSVFQSDVITYLDRLNGMKFDFIFMDPPYKELSLYNQTLELIAKNNLLKETGLIILETSKVQEIVIPEGFTIQKQKKYGISNVLLIANNI